MLFLTCLPTAIAVIIHLWFEKPIMLLLRRSLIHVSETAQAGAPIKLVLEPGSSG